MTELAAPLKVRVDPPCARNEPALVKLPPTLNDMFELIWSAPSSATFTLAQTSPTAVTVMVIPAGMMTLSVAVGAAPVDQLVPVSQSPEARAVLLPATATAERSIIKQINTVAW